MKHLMFAILSVGFMEIINKNRLNDIQNLIPKPITHLTFFLDSSNIILNIVVFVSNFRSKYSYVQRYYSQHFLINMRLFRINAYLEYFRLLIFQNIPKERRKSTPKSCKMHVVSWFVGLITQSISHFLIYQGFHLTFFIKKDQFPVT